ncbi:hypothetical protein GCM10010326_42210 [Streptomyces xanthochromogenes]|uniref:Uncharacterized protein n=1 Tax=Streptomyces xanthochromogenes TaxID=67384 RepID=A0ABQ3AA40_9ACTN|nr:hypothetical protein GCM10010326_42210 [Streptomyces xanthochromogenes]
MPRGRFRATVQMTHAAQARLGGGRPAADCGTSGTSMPPSRSDQEGTGGQQALSEAELGSPSHPPGGPCPNPGSESSAPGGGA